MLKDTVNTDINTKLAAEDRAESDRWAKFENMMDNIEDTMENIMSSQSGGADADYFDALQDLVNVRHSDAATIAKRADALIQVLVGFAEDKAGI